MGRALHLAASLDRVQILQWFLEQQLDNINFREDIGITPLMKAASKGAEKCVVLLLAWGADAKLGDKFGRTALAHAEMNKRSEVAKVLADHMLNLAQRDIKPASREAELPLVNLTQPEEPEAPATILLDLDGQLGWHAPDTIEEDALVVEPSAVPEAQTGAATPKMSLEVSPQAHVPFLDLSALDFELPE
eukprot:m.149535 g.149535  ORF g.149535 m.149535 type:complete len:190 (-) comp52778_c0_seq1:52-621(-)